MQNRSAALISTAQAPHVRAESNCKQSRAALKSHTLGLQGEDVEQRLPESMQSTGSLKKWSSLTRT
jgi:hypothetical protein